MSYSNIESEFRIPDPQETNGVRIIDPNPLGQIVPHEELFIYVNLKARQKSKTLITSDQNGQVSLSNQIKSDVNIGVPQQETVTGSKLFKTKPGLTTDWTEIGGFKKTDNKNYQDFEGFGITNVDIKIQSQSSPIIVIDFIDVRGATLFEQGSCSPYGLFFTLPYPIFELTVKGYYGNAVNYYLHMIKFNTKFNSETGNMECRAEFVGYTFAFLSDTIVSYVAASQKLKKERYNPNEILRQKYVDTITFYEENGLTGLYGQNGQPWCDNTTSIVAKEKSCMTIWDLIKFLKHFEDVEKPLIAGSDENQELESLKLVNDKYLHYLNTLNDLGRELNKQLGDAGTTKTTCTDPSVSGNELKYIFTQPQINEMVKDNGVLHDYFNKINGKLLIAIKDILDPNTKIGNKSVNEAIGISCLLKDPNQFSNQSSAYPLYNNDFINSQPWMVGVLKNTRIAYPPIKDENSYISDGPFIDLGYLLADAKNEYSKISGNDPTNPGILTKKRKDLIEIINNIVKQQIGFDPTIRNIFTVLLCNTDAFMEILKNVAEEAERFHEKDGSIDYKGAGKSNSVIISGEKKVYPWPTYYETNFIKKGKSQGTKEVYPGNKFPDWPEVIFVEDFIKAFLEFQEDAEILNGDIEGKPSYDNFAPINVLESRYCENNITEIQPNKYLNAVGNDKLKVLAERMFLTLDHSHFQPIRMNHESYYYVPKLEGGGNWSPLKDVQYVKNLGKIEAWNLINSMTSSTDIEGLVNNDRTVFINDIIKILGENAKSNGGVFKANVNYTEIARLPNDLSVDIKKSIGYGFGEKYYVYKTTKEGIEIKAGKIVTPNPFDMDADNLFKIIKPIEQVEYASDDKKIKISNDKFSEVLKNYNKDIITNSNKLDFSTTKFNSSSKNWPGGESDKNFPASWDDFSQIISFNKPQLFTTLAMSFLKDIEINSWWENTTDTSFTTSIGGEIVSNMGVISYWDDRGGSDNTTSLVSFTQFIGGTGYTKEFLDPKKDGLITVEGDVQFRLKANIIQPDGSDYGYKFSVATATMATTPLWLDNVINFRKNKFSTDTLTEDDQNKNLAYLFLHTLKPTPLITRFIDNDGYLYNDKFDSDQPLSSVIWSLRAFNTTSGIVKVPKVWLLTLGAQLWRWREFISDNKTWPKILRQNGETTTVVPKGKDPLIQPGIYTNDFATEKTYYDKLNGPLNFRNNPTKYLAKVYNGYTWSGNKHQSVFGYEEKGTEYGGYFINSTSDKIQFNYFNYYKGTDKVGKIGDAFNKVSFQELVTNYSWPFIYIAPHHIPYVSSETFDDNTRGRGSDFVLVSNDWVGYQDYITLMPTTNDGVDYNERDGSGSGTNAIGVSLYDNNNKSTIRTKKMDGNLGTIVQYLPDDVKNKIVDIFEEWAISQEWKDILKVIDPIHFSSDSLVSSYEYQSGKKSPVINNIGSSIREGEEGGYILALKDNDSLKKLLLEQYWIANSTPKIWYGYCKDCGQKANNFYDEGFIATNTQITNYLTSFHDTYMGVKTSRKKEIEDKKGTGDEKEVNLSIVDNGEDLKLSLYRTFKSITDKWITASKDGKLFFNIVNSSNGTACGKLKTKGGSTLAAHFQYINRVMGDIGDIAVIDISKLNILRDNLKISMYQYISDLLTDNEYMFFPLPAYVNFTGQGLKTEDLKEMFKPSLRSISDVSCGPLFLCMYVGGTSRQLKLLPKVNCPLDQEALENLEDDGFSFDDIFKPDEISNPLEYDSDGYTAFKIVYGLENQNHFKSIQLDQAEFSETAESLLVVDKLSQQQGNGQTSQGQNLNSAYLTRSYTCQVESMGNMMIQPMTYFDLQGVPMFSGAYLITEVSHSFKPNNATTNFKGVRQPRATVPIVTDVALAMDLNFNGKVKPSGSLSNRVGNSGGNYNNVYSGLGNNLSNKTTKDSSTKCGYSSCVVTRKGIICALNNIAASSGYPDNYNDWLDFIVKKNFTTTADLDKVKAGFEKLSSGLKIKKDDFVKILNVESYGGDPKAGACATCKCAGIIQWCTFGGGPNVVKNFSKNGKDIVTNIDLKDTFDIVKQPLWRQLDYAYDYMERNFNAFGSKIVRDGNGDVLLSDLYLLVLNPGSITCTGSRGSTQPLGCVIGGVDTDLVIGGTQAKILYDCSLSSNNVNTTQNTQNIGNDYSSNTSKVSCKSSAPISLNATTTHLLLGDSGVKVIQSTVGFSNPSKTKVDIGPNCGGEGVKFLVQSLKQEDIYQNKTYPNVKVIYTQIGVNGGYSDSQTLIKEYNDLITKIFPNAKKVIFGGTLGWGGVKNKTKGANQDPYYKKYQDLGWIYEYPACGEPCATSGSAYNNGKDISHDRTSDYFKAIIDIIDKYRLTKSAGSLGKIGGAI